jgi:L-ascorbate metabolism protein UlaG (beta-lactamase superfamily)
MSDVVQLRWLGQGGYEIVAPDGATLMIDPYLSDEVERELGNARIVPAPIGVDEAAPDVVVATHWHPDHLDPELARSLGRRGAPTTWLGPSTNAGRLVGWGVDPQLVVDLDRGQERQVGPFTVRAGFARHDVPGWLCEDAISVSVEVAGRRIFHTGDTEYDARVLAMRDHGPYDVGLFVMNGTGGCMNVYEAAIMAHQLAPRIAVPCHYGMWADAGYGLGATLDPEQFVELCARLGGPDTRVLEHGGGLSV